MGAKCAPSLANLFMGKWEENVIYAHNRPKLLLWARYIDDVLLLWNGTQEYLHTFMEGLNRNDRGIEFKYEADQQIINVLDLKILLFLMTVSTTIRGWIWSQKVNI